MLSSLQLTDHSKKLRNLPAARRAGEVFRFGGAARYSSLGGRRGIPVWGGRRGIPVWGAARYSGLGGGEVFRFGGAARYSGSRGGRRGIPVWGGGEVFRFGEGRRGIPVWGGGELFLEELSTPRVLVPIPKPSGRGGEVFRFGGAASSSWKSSPPPGCQCPSQNLRCPSQKLFGSSLDKYLSTLWFIFFCKSGELFLEQLSTPYFTVSIGFP